MLRLFLILLSLSGHVALSPASPTFRRAKVRSTSSPRCAGLKCSSDDESTPLVIASAAGLLANPVMWVSLYSVATTGGGLPAGPFGLVGLVEGISYLVVVGFVGAALFKKMTTGSGLPAGPAGLLGAAEGLSFLSILAGVGVLALLVGQLNCVPNALPLFDYSDKVNVCD